MRARLNRTLRRWPKRLSLTVKLLSLLTLMLLLSYGLTLNQFRRDMEDYGRAQLDVLGRAVAYQTALNAAPLILSRDWLSLNIALKQLTDDPQVQGAEVYDRNDKQLAQAGRLGETHYEQPITLQDDRLGKVRIHLSTEPLAQGLNRALRATTLVAVIGGLLTLLALWLLARHFTEALRALQTASARIADDQVIAPLDETRRDEFGDIHRQLNRRFAPEPEPEAISEQLEELEALAQALAEPAAEPHPDAEPPVETETETATGSIESLEAPSMPTEDAGTAATTDPAPTSAPTDTAEAGSYLLYIDHHGASSDSLPESERRQLLDLYRVRLDRVAQLYNGQVAEDTRGNWYVRFAPLSNDHSHGINALCAAQLFNGLYRGLNQHRIRRFSPVANMKMALVTGDNTDTLLQQAGELTAAIAANELITAQSVFDVEPLQARLLAGGDYRRTDRSAYLLTRLSADFQELIDRQVDHFLKNPG